MKEEGKRPQPMGGNEMGPHERSVHEKALELRSRTEAMVVGIEWPRELELGGHPRLTRWLHETANSLRRHVISPPMFLLRGARHAIMRGLVFFYVGFAALFAILVSVPEAALEWESLGADRGAVLGGIAISLPIIWRIFALPSSYAYCAVRGDDVGKVRAYLSDLNVRREAEVGAMSAAISDLEEGARKRTAALRWLALALWAVTGFFATRYLDALLVSPQGAEARAYLDELLLATLTLYLVAQSYTAAIDRVNKAVRFALYDLSVEVASHPEATPELHPKTSPNGSRDTRQPMPQECGRVE